MKKYTVKKHGNMFVDISEPVICPECGELVQSKGKYDYESDWVFFDCFLVKTETTNYICDNCKCRFCEEPETNIVQVDWSTLFYIILLILCILYGSFHLYFGLFLMCLYCSYQALLRLLFYVTYTREDKVINNE